MRVPLTEGTAQRIARLFSPADRELVSTSLLERCGDNLPFAGTAAGIERIRFAVLKVSGGDLGTLQRAIDLANQDWRDLLVAAGFEHDPSAHSSWWPDPPQS
jgi:hypothetical protein